DVVYEYDPRGQLVSATYGNHTAYNESYDFDENGNREEVTNTIGSNKEYDTAADNRLTSDDYFTYEYDDEGNRTRRYVDGGSAGFGSGDTYITEYTWDHRNRLTNVTHYASYSDYSSNPDQEIEYSYDAFDQLIKRVADPDGPNSSYYDIRPTIFVWENGQVVLQYDGFGYDEELDEPTSVTSYTNLTHRYLWGP